MSNYQQVCAEAERKRIEILESLGQQRQAIEADLKERQQHLADLRTQRRATSQTEIRKLASLDAEIRPAEHQVSALLAKLKEHGQREAAARMGQHPDLIREAHRVEAARRADLADTQASASSRFIELVSDEHRAALVDLSRVGGAKLARRTLLQAYGLELEEA